MSSIKSISNLQLFVMTSNDCLLKKSTIERLIALGIDPTSVTSEAQAQYLIEQAEAAKRKENNDFEEQGGQQQENHKAELIQQNMFDTMNMISVSNRLILGL